jgi:hypothetical protein
MYEMGCIACWKDGCPNTAAEIHHLNLGGHAGQKRRGDEFTIPLCKWHHQAHRMNGFTSEWHYLHLGPSLAKHSREFREKYGLDDELLAKVNDLIRQTDEIAAGKACMSEADVSHATK